MLVKTVGGKYPNRGLTSPDAFAGLLLSTVEVQGVGVNPRIA